MGLFDSGMINFIKLLIIIGLISMLYMIVMQKIKEQNHKISSLLSVVSSMAVEITNLKTPDSSEPVYDKIDISNDSDSEASYSDSDTDDENSRSENIEFFEVEPKTFETDLDVIEVVETINEDELVDETIETVDETNETGKENILEYSVNYKKMSISKLAELATGKNLVTREKAGKMKKKDLIDLLS